MLFFFRKVIEAMLMPIGFCALLVVAGACLRRRWLALVGVALLLLLSTPTVSRLLLTPLEHAYPSETVASAPSADAVVILSGGLLRGRSPAGIQWDSDANRYFTGFNLAMAGKAKFLVLSAGLPPGPRSLDQGAVLRQISIQNGFPADRIVVTRHVLTTEDESRAVSELPGIHSILLVTSAFHMPRAVLLFQARNLLVYPFPTDNKVLSRDWGEFALVPSPSALRDSELALREYYGLAIYRTLLLFHPSSR